MPYRVDNLPKILLPLYLLISYSLALMAYLWIRLIHFTCRINFVGQEHLQPDKNYIYCFWHTNIIPYFVVFIRHPLPHAWMNHPAAMMKPVHVILSLIGVKKIILGSKGKEGQEAIESLADYLKRGYSTVIAPDGPSGPAKQLKKGVLYCSLKSQVAIVPMSFQLSKSLRLKTWDTKQIPLPFSKITVTYQAPILVNQENFEKAYEDLVNALS